MPWNWMPLRRSLVRLFRAFYDIIAVAFAYLLFVVWVLNGFDWEGALFVIGVATFAAAPALYLAGVHRHVWRYVSVRDAASLTYAALMVAAATGVAIVIENGVTSESAKAIIGSAVLVVAFWMAPRLIVRLALEAQALRHGQDLEIVTNLEPVILFGAGPQAEAFVRTNEKRKRYNLLVILSDNVSLHGSIIRGVRVAGGLADLGHLLAYWRSHDVRPTRLIVSEDGERKDELADALTAAAEHGLRLSRLPRLTDLSGGARADQAQPVAIEDILNRDPVALDRPSVTAFVRNRSILITGAGGSIGSELVRQVATLEPAEIVLLEENEFNLYRIDGECARRFPNVPRRTALCDVRDRAGLERWFASAKPHVVLHAAALKHVPMLEDHPDQAVLTNVAGTRNVAELARQYGAEAMVLVSTDKAVNPTNIMGATKRYAEMICQAMDAERTQEQPTRFVSVRFGNVLASAGSVVPLFTQQIAEGGPVTVTHKDMTRFFMTIPEAVQLILMASASAVRAPERASSVYVLDMGEPVKIMDLAERLIQLSGKRPHIDIPIRIVGLRPGEKLYEELAHDEEQLTPAPDVQKAFLARSRAPALKVALKGAEALCAVAETGDGERVVETMMRLIPEFDPMDAAIEHHEQPSIIPFRTNR